MCSTVSTNKSCTVERKHHGQVLQRYVVDQLVVRTLQESGVNRHHRLHPLTGQARCQRDGVLLGNTHVVITLGKPFVELDHPRALAHGGRDAHETIVLRGHVAQPLAKHLGERGLGWRGGRNNAHRRVKLARPVVSDRVGLSQLVTLAFFGDHVQKLRSIQVLDVFQRRDQRVQVMPINGPDVVEAKLLKQSCRHHHTFGMLFKALGQLKQGRCSLEHLLGALFSGGVKATAHQLRQVAVKCANGWADRHVVVVEDDQEFAVFHPPVVEGFKSHASGHGPIANNGYRVAVFALLASRQSHAQRCRNAGGGVPHAKRVVLAFVTTGKARQAIELSQRRHALAPSRQDLVRISLVAHIPHDAVFGCVEHIVQRNRELHRTQVGAEVPTGFGDVVQHALAHFVGHAVQIVARQLAQVLGRVNGLEQSRHGFFNVFSAPPSESDPAA